MKTQFFLQVSVIISYTMAASWIPGFGDRSEEPRRIRIYLDDDEQLLVPENSRVEYVNPVVNIDDIYFDKQIAFPEIGKKEFPLLDHFSNYGGLGQYGNLGSYGAYPTTSPYNPLGARLKLEDVRVTYGGYQNGVDVGANPSAAKDMPIAMGKLLRPVLLLPNGYIRGVDVASMSGDIKPVTEETTDDLKYDFRTKTHSIRR